MDLNTHFTGGTDIRMNTREMSTRKHGEVYREATMFGCVTTQTVCRGATDLRGSVAPPTDVLPLRFAMDLNTHFTRGTDIRINTREMSTREHGEVYWEATMFGCVTALTVCRGATDLRYELQDSIEHPALCLAHSGRFIA